MEEKTVEKQRILLKVSEINARIRDTLEQDFSSIWVQGEISNFVSHSSGHWYFSLKDKDSQIKGVMFRGNNRSVSFPPKNGSQVLVHGNISAYAPRGTYQVLCDQMELLGSGDLQQQFEELKQKLLKEGLFDKSHKKEIPAYPRHIAVITSETGAALRDILQVLRRRSRGLKITLVPSLVQGEEAAKNLIQALELAEKIPHLDTIILGRGGGSMEDLYAFNDEALARKVAEIKTPVISAVGHEIDFTICDFVADLRAPTPSAAAELVVKNTGDLEEKLSKTKLQMIQGIRLQLKYFKEKLVGLDKQVIHPRRLLQDRFQRVDELLSQLVQSTRQTLIREQAQVQKFKEILESLNPKQILQRGFCLALDSKNKIITDSKKLKVKESISLEFFKGGAKALITSKE